MSTPGEITADSTAGRVLLALRAGVMTNGELYARVPGYSGFMGMLVYSGYVIRTENGWRITDAGRATCPLRNPLAGKVTLPSVTPVTRPPVPVGLPSRTAPKTHVHRPTTSTQTGGTRMSNPARKTSSPAVVELRRLLVDAPDGLPRKDIIKRTGLADYAVDNAISNLIRTGEAMRKGYGVIALVADGARVTAARVAAADAFSATIAGQAAGVAPPPEAVVLPAPVIAVKDPDVPAAPATPATGVDFAIYDDGRLAISAGDEIFVLPPDATRRLGQFLGRIEINGWPSHL